MYHLVLVWFEDRLRMRSLYTWATGNREECSSYTWAYVNEDVCLGWTSLVCLCLSHWWLKVSKWDCLLHEMSIWITKEAWAGSAGGCNGGLCFQVHQYRWLQAAQLLAHSLQIHQQRSHAAAHPADSAEPAAQSGTPQTGNSLERCVEPRELVWPH